MSLARGVLLIGVGKPNGPIPLPAVEPGIARMKAWAQGQGIPDGSIRVVTDAQDEVRLHQVKDALDALVTPGNLDQLLIYFAGHGINLHLNEYWLLSRAPDDPDEAVSIAGSIEFARRSIVPHVVFISDACRTAPAGIQGQSVTGGHLFPNLGGNGPSKAVDVFYACALGAPANEIPDPLVSSGQYRAIYTDALADGLGGNEPSIVEPGSDGGRYVRPRPLDAYLRSEVPRRAPALSQLPDAIIPSDPNAWLARFDGAGPATPVGPDGIARRLIPPPPGPSGLDLYGQATEDAFRQVLTDPLSTSILRNTIDRLPARGFGETHARRIGDEVARAGSTRESLGVPAPIPCGFEVLGNAVRRNSSTSGTGRLKVSVDGATIEVDGFAGPATEVLLGFRDGTTTVLPAIRNYVATLTFQGHELTNVAYEPSAFSPYASEYQSQNLGPLRRVIASSSQHGSFKLEGEQALQLAQRMQFLKVSDPSLAIYAAYAYYALNEGPRIREMEGFLARDLHLRLFDLAMLGSESGARSDAGAPIFPRFPLLAQGWALLPAFRAETDPRVLGLQRHLTNSLWSHFEPAAVEQLRSLF